MNLSQALNVWIIQAVVAIGPPLGALLFHVYIKTDWGIPLFFLMPLALIAIPAVRVRKIALLNLTATWLVISLVVLAASPKIVAYEVGEKRTAGATYRARSELARELTEVWHTRFDSRWPVVVGLYGYRPAHDLLQPRSSGAADAGRAVVVGPDLARGGEAIGLHRHLRNRPTGSCEECEAWMKAHAANAERMVMTTRRFFLGQPGPATAWNIYHRAAGQIDAANRKIRGGNAWISI